MSSIPDTEHSRIMYRIKNLDTGEWWESTRGRRTFESLGAAKVAYRHGGYSRPKNYKIVTMRLVEVEE